MKKVATLVRKMIDKILQNYGACVAFFKDKSEYTQIEFHSKWFLINIEKYLLT